jgi:hypothetical protein
MKSYILTFVALLFAGLLSAQNVGIGTTTPTEKLHVNGNIRVADDADILGVDVIQGFNDIRLFATPTSTDADVYINGDGNVGINTTAPQATLDVNGTAKINSLGGSTTQMVVSDPNGNLSVQALPSSSTVRSIIITPGMIASNNLAGVTSGNIGGWVHPCLDYADGVTGTVYFSLPSPADWDGTPMSVKVLYTSTGNSGNFQFMVFSRGLLIGDDINQGVGGGGLTLPAPTAPNILSEGSMTGGFGIQVANQAIMNMWFRREGGGAQDTSTDLLRVLGFVITYNTL